MIDCGQSLTNNFFRVPIAMTIILLFMFSLMITSLVGLKEFTEPLNTVQYRGKERAALRQLHTTSVGFIAADPLTDAYLLPNSNTFLNFSSLSFSYSGEEDKIKQQITQIYKFKLEYDFSSFPFTSPHSQRK